jgi:hypothetical protein
MPILKPAQSDAELRQGDVLCDVIRYLADYRDNAAPAAEKGHVIVVSRPCNALRAQRIVVAPLKKRSLADLKEAKDISELLDAYTAIRDGDGTPDSFYVGELEPGSDRYFAKLDELSTVLVPVGPHERRKFTDEHRKFHLDNEFVRDLHVRIFRAFGSLGFDDDTWWSDEDLSYVMQRGDADEGSISSEIAQLRARITTLQIAEGAQKEQKQVEASLAACEGKREKLRALLEPLRAESSKRILSAKR